MIRIGVSAMPVPLTYWKNSCSRIASFAHGLALFLLALNLNSQTLVTHSEVWRYRKGTSAPQTDWKTTADASLDGTWLSGAGGFGYADNTPETALCRTFLTDMQGNYSTVMMRR